MKITTTTSLLCALLCLSVPVFAQDFTKIDAHARSVSVPKRANVAELADELTAGCTTETEKARSFYVWIADNIRYDVKALENMKDMDPEDHIRKQSPEKVLRTKKAVCEGYSKLFSALCEAAGMESIMVTGHSKSAKGIVRRSFHAWNMVRVDGQWKLLDATWGSGDVDPDEGKYTEEFDEKYFFTAPDVMIANHYPQDPLFQLSAHPITFKEFGAGKAQDGVKKEVAEAHFSHLTDSLNAYIAQDSLTQMFRRGTRSLMVNPGNNYGTYMVGDSYFQRAGNEFKKYIQDSEYAQGERGIINAAWCDEQLARLQFAEVNFGHCIANLTPPMDNDQYAPAIRSLRRNAESNLKSVKEAAAYWKKMRKKL